MRSSVKHDDIIERAFDKIAGAAFALGWLSDPASEQVSIESPLFGWLLSMNALATANADTTAADRICSDVDRLVCEVETVNTLDRSTSQQFHTFLTTSARCEWSYWLPILLFSPILQREQYWDSYQKYFLVDTDAERAFHRLLYELLDETQRELLFTSEENSHHSSQAEAVLIRVGKQLKALHDTAQGEQKRIFSSWLDYTREAVKYIRSGLRVSHKLRLKGSEFLDFLIALLAVAEWRTQPDIWRVPTFIESYRQHPNEVLNSRQLALSGALFGYYEGYHRVAAGVQNPSLRRMLSAQAMTLTSAVVCREGQGDAFSYLPAFASEPGTAWMFVSEMTQKGSVQRRWSHERGVEPDATQIDTTAVQVAFAGLDIRFLVTMEKL